MKAEAADTIYRLLEMLTEALQEEERALQEGDLESLDRAGDRVQGLIKKIAGTPLSGRVSSADRKRLARLAGEIRCKRDANRKLLQLHLEAVSSRLASLQQGKQLIQSYYRNNLRQENYYLDRGC